eukprot:5237872-Prorocentrum_lima.AAC.1
MCIRDRSESVRLRSPTLNTLQLGAMKKSWWTVNLLVMLWDPQLSPVSYTHLTLPTICSV